MDSIVDSSIPLKTVTDPKFLNLMMTKFRFERNEIMPFLKEPVAQLTIPKIKIRKGTRNILNFTNRTMSTLEESNRYSKT